MAELQGAHIERVFIPLVPCPDGAPHFHIPKGMEEKYADWNYIDTFVNQQTKEAWMLAARRKEDA